MSENLWNIGPVILTEIVTGGDFTDETIARSSSNDQAISQLAGNHEEANPRRILHAQDAVKRTKHKRLIIICRDTDVLLLLVYNFGKQPLEVWMVSGTRKKIKCYPIHIIAQNMPTEVLQNLIGFHALTGCDSVSSFSGYAKKSCWKVITKYPQLLSGVGRNGEVNDVEEFVC